MAVNWGGALTHSPAEIAVQALIDLGIGSERGADWPVGFDKEPDDPDNVITVRNTQGTDGERGMISGLTDRQWGLQLMIRARKSEQGRYKAALIAQALEQAYGMNVTVAPLNSADSRPQGVYRLHAFVGVGQPLPLGDEEGSNRFMHSLNARMVVRQLS